MAPRSSEPWPCLCRLGFRGPVPKPTFLGRWSPVPNYGPKGPLLSAPDNAHLLGKAGSLTPSHPASLWAS